ncbi:LuxR C-terminal-related transcriptional regulator [Polymorphobacter fuscus]|uniref:Response regulator n=1 Tax=Sandarakinorhabdus fusca TaxID=1439888 RepID=A0A7C9GM48_9SPHN|nr:response regulator transcription factor [Polymorphobacter fuscus]KAB7648209.1 response regulator transcription factor [Polymorphobacter fuscus]MQT15712.1 response regulator [Polymorphobacter fuscus]NJC08017.1 DNA-binding NarL/FixJ family response regulator [Polymorphobacter fuscus]
MRWNGRTTETPESGQTDARRCAETRTRLLVADHLPLVRAGLSALLAEQGHHVVAEAGDGMSVLTALGQWEIDVAMIAIDLPDLDMPNLIAAVRDRGWALPIVVLAPTAQHPAIAAVLDRGAAGMVLKTESADALQQCVATVAAGGRWIDRSAAAEVAERGQVDSEARQLTRRERDVARLVATGQRNRAIAGTLGISEGTVKMHLHNVYAKLGLESRTQLAMDARVRMSV